MEIKKHHGNKKSIMEIKKASWKCNKKLRSLKNIRFFYFSVKEFSEI